MSSFEVLPASCQRPDNWAASNNHSHVRYRVLANAQPATLCQVLNLLAMQYLVPCAINVLRQGDDLHIDLNVDGLSWHRAQVIAEKMRNLIDVDRVDLEAALSLPIAGSDLTLATA